MSEEHSGTISSLRADCSFLMNENDTLKAQVKELKEKLSLYVDAPRAISIEEARQIKGKVWVCWEDEKGRGAAPAFYRPEVDSWAIIYSPWNDRIKAKYIKSFHTLPTPPSTQEGA